MGQIIEKIIIIFLVIVFITYMCNHGILDFTGVDFVKDKTVEYVKSDEGQSTIKETKEISRDVYHNFLDGIRYVLDDDSDSEAALKEKYKDTEDNEEISASSDTSSEACTFVNVIDGDKIRVKLNDKEVNVRLIGIDCPDSNNIDETQNNEFGQIAADYTAALLASTNELYLEYDVTKEDQDGNLLAYVWFTSDYSDNTDEEIGTYMLNGVLVKNGYATDKVFMPNCKYADNFMNLKRVSRNNKEGLWAEKEFEDLYSE